MTVRLEQRLSGKRTLADGGPRVPAATFATEAFVSTGTRHAVALLGANGLDVAPEKKKHQGLCVSKHIAVYTSEQHERGTRPEM